MVRAPAVSEPHLGYCPALTKPTKHISPVNRAIASLMRQFLSSSGSGSGSKSKSKVKSQKSKLDPEVGVVMG